MQMNNRQRKLIQLLLNHYSPMHGNEIASYLGSTTRTLRQDIFYINDILKKQSVKINSSSSKGYWINESDKHTISSYIHMQKDDLIPANQSQREIATCFYLLEHDEDYVSMGLLADLFYVSKTTISNTIKNIEDIISASKGLTLNISLKKGLLLTGSEFYKRNLFSSIILLFYELEGSFINRYIQQKYDIYHCLNTLYETLKEYYSRQKIMLTNKSLMITIYELIIVSHRIQEKKYLHSLEHIHTGPDMFPFHEIEIQLNMSLSENDRMYLNQLLSKKRTYSLDDKLNTSNDKPDMVTQEFYAEVLKKFHLDLNPQKKLTEHINTMIYYHQTTHAENFNNNDIKVSHPYAYEIACLMNPIIEKYTQLPLSLSELNSLTARISVILDNNIEKFNVIILTNQSTSMTELLESKLQLYFSQLLNIIGIYPLYQISTLNINSTIDFILSTSREFTSDCCDVIYISSVLSTEDLTQIVKHINHHLPSVCG